MIGSILKFGLSKVLPALVLAIAIFFGWCNLDETLPWEARFFACLIPTLKGYLPPLLFGHGKNLGAKMTPPVPADLKPMPRPKGELFTTLEGSGDAMPMSGLGMCCRPSAYDFIAVERTIEWYLLKGGRHIDGAHLYTNHHAIGKGIANAIAKGIPREEIFMVTKIWPSEFGYNRTMELVPTFLDEKNLNLDYLDMVLMHFPSTFTKSMPKGCAHLSSITECRQETWKALSELKARGLLRNVGVSNFATHHLEELLELENVAPIANNQINWNPWVPKEWLDTVAFCKEHKIAITGYSPLGGAFDYDKAIAAKVLNELAAKHGRSVSNIMLRWALQTGATIIPGTGNPKYMDENLSVYDFELSEEEMATIEALRESDSAKQFTTIKPGQFD